MTGPDLVRSVAPAAPDGERSGAVLGGVSFTGEAFRLQRYGGVSRYILELHRELRRQGIESQVTSTSSISRMTTADDELLGSSRPAWLRGPGSTRVGVQWGARADRRAASALPRNWVVHRSYYGPYSSTGNPVVATVYDMIAELFPDEFANNDPTARHKAEALRHADVVFAISEHTKKDVMRILDVPEAKIRVVPIGVGRIDEAAESRRRAQLPSERYVLYVGARAGYKNFDVVMRAMGAKRSPLALVCFGGTPFTADEIDVLGRRGLRDRVRHVTGDDDLLGALYRQAECLVYPSRYEGFGIPPLEAMHRDCPVIASHAASIPEVVGDGAVLIDPEDADGLLAAVERLIEDPEHRRTLIERGRARAQHYSWQSIAAEAIGHYAELV